jgi:surface antigen
MSVLERYKQRSAYRKSEDGISSLPPQESIYQSFPLEQSSLFDSSAQTGGATPVPQLWFPDDSARFVSDQGLAPSVVPETSTALIPQDMPNRQVALPAQTSTKTPREPTLIRGTGTKSSGTMFAPKISGKRTLTHAAVVALTFIVVLVVLGAVLPLTGDGQAKGAGSWLNALMNWSHAKNDNTALIASQIATATAVTQDGYDPGGVTFPGVPGAPSSSPNLNRFFYGQCTYWANMRYGQLTGRYVPWLGNANAWSSQAAAYGWVVSSTPRLHAIVAFAPYVQGAGYYGHVAVVESINGNDITTSNWNVAGSAWATTTYLINHPGPGVTFLYHPDM